MAGTTKEVTRRAAEGAGRWPGVPKAHAPPRRGASDSETGGDAGSGERNVPLLTGRPVAPSDRYLRWPVDRSTSMGAIASSGAATVASGGAQ